MASYKFLIFLVLSLIAMTHVRGNGVDEVCKRSTDDQFCKLTFSHDPRSATANLQQLGLISIQITLNFVQETADRTIPDVRNKVNDPVGLQRLKVCQSDYEAASQKFGEAMKSMDKKAYYDVINFVRDGTNSVIDCQNVYRRTEPIAESPISAQNHNVVNLSGVILTVNQMLLGQ